MSSIGPAIPSRFLNQKSDQKNEEQDDSPPHIICPRQEVDEDEDDYAPALPPDMISARSAAPTVSKPPEQRTSTNRRVVGPSFPSYPPIYDPDIHSLQDDDDDDDFGPKPLPAGVRHAEKDAVTEFLEREERRKKLAEEANKPKTLQREEWMLVPPSSSDLLGGLDPTKLTKGRQFSRSTAPASSKQDNSLWTETPAERQQRLADEVSGKKRRAVDTASADDAEDTKRRRKGDEAVRRGVDEYTRKIRGPALVDQHLSSGKVEAAKEKEKDAVIWEHSRDMSLGGRLMDDSKRNQMVKEARGLDSRFGKGSSGGFL